MKFEPLVRSLARKYYRTYRYKIASYEDLYQTIWYLVMYALDLYDPEKGALAGHVKRTVVYKLNSMMKGEKAPKSGEYPFTFLRQDTAQLFED